MVKRIGFDVHPAKVEDTAEGRQKILEDAIKCVCHDRNAQYGSPERSFAEIAEVWSWYLGLGLMHMM